MTGAESAVNVVVLKSGVLRAVVRSVLHSSTKKQRYFSAAILLLT